MLFRLFKNTNMMALFFVIIAVATCIYSSLTYKCITLFERELNKVKNHVSTMSTTMESMLQNNMLPSVAPICDSSVQQNMENMENTEKMEQVQEKEKEDEKEKAPEKPRNDNIEGGENQETEDTHSQASFEDEMLRINEIVTSIQTDSGEGGGESSQKKAAVAPSVPTQSSATTPTDHSSDKKTPKLDMNALSQMKYGELQSFVKNRFGVMLRVNKIDMLKKIEEMEALESVSK